MAKWEETVLSKEEIREIAIEAIKDEDWSVPPEVLRQIELRVVAKAQAKITWEARDKLAKEEVAEAEQRVVARDPKFQQEKYRLFDRDTGLTQIYTLSELISKTFRRAKFEYRGKWTGLKDKNGKEIYEGDILQLNKGEFYEVVWRDDECAFYLSCNEMEYVCLVIKEDCPLLEVIGNIYENPELLKEI